MFDETSKVLHLDLYHVALELFLFTFYIKSEYIDVK